MLRRHRYYKPKRAAARARTRVLAQPPRAPRITRAKTIVAAIFFAAALAWFGYFFLASDNFAIKTVAIAGNRNISTQELTGIVLGVFAEPRFLFLPGDNIFFVSKQGIVDAIAGQYLVDEITVTRKLPFELRVGLVEKLSRVVLRVKTPVEIIPAPEDVQNGGESGEQADVSHNNVTETEGTAKREVEYTEMYYLLDVNGIVVSNSPVSEADRAELPTIEIIRPGQSQINPGTSVLNRETVELIFELYERAKASQQSLAVSYVSLDPENGRELTAVTQEGWQAFLSTQIPLETQMQKLELALMERIKEQRALLQYVDLRVKDRVYFK